MSNPGWYPDPEGGQAARWWDGAQWTTHVSPYQVPEVLKAPAGTKTDTVWIWLIVLLPLLSIASIFLIDIPGYMRTILANPTSPTATFAIYTQPGYLIVTGLGWLLVILMVVFAVLDHRELRARQVPKPFHWAWAFLSIVYPIGRSVVVKRRTGGGLNPLWALIVVYAISFIVTIIWTIMITMQIMTMVPNYTSLYS